MAYQEGQTATGPNGEKAVFRGGVWVKQGDAARSAPEYGPFAHYGPQGEVLNTDPKTGRTSMVAASLDADAMKEVQALHSDIGKLEGLTANDEKFLAHNRVRGTGGIGEIGAASHVNPLYEWNKRHDPHMGAMSGISAQEIFQMRPDGSGRVLQSEIPIFATEALSPENTRPVNQERAKAHAIQLELAREKLRIMEEHKRQTGRYTGYEERWSPRMNEILGRYAADIAGARKEEPKRAKGLGPRHWSDDELRRALKSF